VRPIEIGHRNNETAELLSGRATDATVILHPCDKVTDGVRVSKFAGGDRLWALEDSIG
jgi:HlyD family secretion protein